jgi:putative glutathione S-transferase
VSDAASIVEKEVQGGEFRRQRSAFRDWIGPDPRAGGEESLPAQAGRYHLYVSLACPWCHRTVVVRELAGLADAVPLHFVAPYRDERGWAFTDEEFDDGPGGRYIDALNGWAFLAEAYYASDPGYSDRVTAPVLWDADRGRIVNNESADIVRMMGEAGSLGGLAGGAQLDLYPQALRAEIDEINVRCFETIGNAVYRCGFARSQEAYDEAFGELFDSLDWMDALLGERRFLLGDSITEADWRIFPTLVRFDEVYVTHFRCNYRRLVDYRNIWPYARDLYQQPGVAETVAMDQIKRHYYTTHDELNPKRIIPVGPGYDWSQPPERG